ncbi:MAG TPA: PaaI family thioesterase [Candidatus Eremiobacteraceae bacterium]|nr:PaaI family thioesterase [Candidatus Eremiobacteraceae bacterium]
MPARGIDPNDVPERYRRLFSENPFADHFELEVVSYGQGEAALRFPYKKLFTQYQGAVQGGIIAAYCDAAIAVAVLPLIPEGKDMVTTDLHVQYLRPVISGPVIARAHVVHRGNTLLLANATAENEAGTICARCTATYMIVSPRGVS